MHAQVELPYVLVLGQFGGRLVHDDGARLDDVAVVGQGECEGGVLLDEEHGRPLAVDLGDELPDLAHEAGGETQAGLVEEEVTGAGHERPAHGQHLLLATRQEAGPGFAAGCEDREEAVDPLEGLLHAPLVGMSPKTEILLHGQLGQDAPALHDLGQAPGDDAGRVETVDPLVVEADLAFGDAPPVDGQEPRDGAQERGLARPVGAEQGHDPAFRQAQADPTQDEDRIVVDDLEVLDGQHRDEPPLSDPLGFGVDDPYVVARDLRGDATYGREWPSVTDDTRRV